MSKSKLSDRQINLFLVVSAIAVFAIVSLIASAEKALASGVAFGVFGAIISVKLEKKQSWRFWAAISVFALAHIVAIVIIHFPEPRFGLVSLPFALVDGFIMWTILGWIEKRFAAPNEAD